jgi:uncharacterized membrane protein YdjX (TVP38/TMEM64 family)
MRELAYYMLFAGSSTISVRQFLLLCSLINLIGLFTYVILGLVLVTRIATCDQVVTLFASSDAG